MTDFEQKKGVEYEKNKTDYRHFIIIPVAVWPVCANDGPCKRNSDYLGNFVHSRRGRYRNGNCLGVRPQRRSSHCQNGI